MKNFISTILLCFALLEVHGQVNLVPNFSFEEYSDCPMNDGQSYFASGWSRYSNASSTPDYYNACSVDGWGIPKSLFSYQFERRNCNAYIGLSNFTTNLSNYREHLGIELSQQLTIAQKYYISFYVVLSEFFSSDTYYGMPSNKIGVRLSTVSFSENNPFPIDNFSHLYAENVMTDSVNWVKISGSIIADSAYKYLVLGNFFDDNNTNIIPYQCANCLNSGSYYLVDDVCVSSDSLVCNPNFELSCEVSLEKIQINKIKIYPNPSDGEFVVENNTENPLVIRIYDPFFSLIFEGQLQAILNIDFSSFSKGLYFIEAMNNDKKLQFFDKLIIN
jgi:hypothetical protein